MKFPRGCKLHLVAAQEAGRYAMHFIKLEITGPHAPALVATDGRALALLPVDLEEGETMPTVLEGMEHVLIPAEAIKAACTLKGNRIDDWNSLTLTDTEVIVKASRGGLGGTQIFARPSKEEAVLEFPRYLAVVPQREDMKDPRAVSFNAAYLHGLVDVLDVVEDAVRLTIDFDGANLSGDGLPVRPIIVDAGSRKTADGRTAFAVLMPITIP